MSAEIELLLWFPQGREGVAIKLVSRQGGWRRILNGVLSETGALAKSCFCISAPSTQFCACGKVLSQRIVKPQSLVCYCSILKREWLKT